MKSDTFIYRYVLMTCPLKEGHVANHNERREMSRSLKQTLSKLNVELEKMKSPFRFQVEETKHENKI